ncbi:hypothetical protein PACTADRAFT_51723 [Pachysolen tannophilus NRRL Y-2460]|uniref:Protein STU1 n=1 Tax=Pachysolen tannophilus NRRL Y-2460 TaxID=669874 RepID=A0A1E4TQE3_PACTA|nr:hypothetical protein PACTADRAFT_51723 [Pachysolen tannophilus NRRL Y-2460]
MSGNYSAEELYDNIAGNYDTERKELLVAEFKTHVKRDFVNLNEVPRNFEALILAINSNEFTLSSIAFSTLCHLVKRVSMQDSSVLRNCYRMVIPVLIDRLGDIKSSSRSASRKALQVYWSSCASPVENIIKEYGLNHDDYKIKIECLTFLNSLVDIAQQNFMFKPFTSKIVNLLLDSMESVQNNSKKLLINFFKNSNNKNAKLDLATELIKQKIPKTIAHSLLMEIDPNILYDYQNLYSINNNPINLNNDSDINDGFINAGSIKITASNSIRSNNLSSNNNFVETNFRSTPHSTLVPKSVLSRSKIQSFPPDFETENEYEMDSIRSVTKNSKPLSPRLENYLSNIPGSSLDDIEPIKISNAVFLRNEIEEMLQAFNGKETEFNWSLRENHIIKLRSIIRGNSCRDFPDVLSQCLRVICDSISKAISSLRTTLSAHGCQLVKEISIFVGDHLDHVTIEVFATTLLKLSGSTKKIAAQNAMVSFSTLIANLSYHPRIVNQVYQASQDKNIQPRLYATTWIDILILKHKESLETINNGLGLELFEKAITKCLSDQNAAVRESMRNTYWLFFEFWPIIAEKIINKFDAKIKKALEKCKPQDLIATNIATPSSVHPVKERQSIRNFIAAKSKEAKSSSVHSSVGSMMATRTSSRGSVSRQEQNHQQQGNNLSEINKQAGMGLAQKARRIPSNRASSLSSAGVTAAHRSRSEEIKIEKDGSFSSTHPHTNKSTTKDIFNRAASTGHEFIGETSDAISAEKDLGAAREKIESLKKALTEKSNSHESSHHTLSTPENDEKLKKDDLIIKLLRSDSHEMKSEAILLLKYALMSKEEMPSELSHLLNSSTLNDPSLLEPILSPDLLSETVKYLSPENFLRCYIINSIKTQAESKIDVELINALVGAMTIENLYSASSELINIMNNICLVVNGKLTMQFIKFKFHISRFVNHLLLNTLKYFPINDEMFSKLSDVLILSIDLVKSSKEPEDLENYKKLIILLYEINPVLFRRSLSGRDSLFIDKISLLTSIDFDSYERRTIKGGRNTDENDIEDEDEQNTSDELMTIDGMKASSLYEMTMIQPKNIQRQISKDVIGNSASGNLNDMTMIMPNFINKSRLASSKTTNDIAKKIETVLAEQEEDSQEYKERAGIEEPINGNPDNEIEKKETVDQPNLNSIMGNDNDLEMEESGKFQDQIAPSDDDNDVEMSEHLIFEHGVKHHNDATTAVTNSIQALDDKVDYEGEHVVSDQKDEKASVLFQPKKPNSTNAELVSNFENVKISSPPPQSPSAKTQAITSSKIQEIIDKSDPFSAVSSSSSRSIQIYEDEDEKDEKNFEFQIRSPLAPLDLSAEGSVDKKSWYSFESDKVELLSKYQRTPISERLYEILLEKFLASAGLSDKEFLILFKYLKTTNKVLDFSKIFKFFELKDLSKRDILNGLVLLNHTVITSKNIDQQDLKKTWFLICMSLIKVVNTFEEELYFALLETRNELINVDPKRILSYCFSLESSIAEGDNKQRSFLMSTILRILRRNGSEVIGVQIDEEIISNLDRFCFPHILDNDAFVRRNAILIYSILLKKIKTDTGDFVISDEKIFNKFSAPQIKLIEYYAEA